MTTTVCSAALLVLLNDSVTHLNGGVLRQQYEKCHGLCQGLDEAAKYRNEIDFGWRVTMGTRLSGVERSGPDVVQVEALS